MSAELKELFRTLKISEVFIEGFDGDGYTDLNVVSEDPSVNGEGGTYEEQIIDLCYDLLDEVGVTDTMVGFFSCCTVKIRYDGAKFNITGERTIQTRDMGAPPVLHTQEISF